MNNLDPEKLQELYPQAFWAGCRKGREETLADPATQKQMADNYLKANLAKPSPSTPTQPLPAAPSPQPVQISATQAEINNQLGLSTEEFTKYNRTVPSQLDEVQAEINGKLGLSEETFLKYAR